MSDRILIPREALEETTLRALVEEYVSREGTDYGHVEYDLQLKVDQVICQIDAGDVVIVFDSIMNQAGLMLTDHYQNLDVDSND